MPGPCTRPSLALAFAGTLVAGCNAAQVTGTASPPPASPTATTTNTNTASDGATAGQPGSAPSAQGDQAAGGAPTGAADAAPSGEAASNGNGQAPTAGAVKPGNGNSMAGAAGNANDGNAAGTPATSPPSTPTFAWDKVRYAFFGLQHGPAAGDVAEGLALFLTANPNFCTAAAADAFTGLPSDNPGALAMGTLTAGEQSIGLQLPAASAGNANGAWLGVQDYGVVQVSRQTHALTRASAVALSPNTCVLRDPNAPSYAARFVVEALGDQALAFTLVNVPAAASTGATKAAANVGTPLFTYALTARRCDFTLPLVQATAAAQGAAASNVGSASPGGGEPFVPCRPADLASGTR